MPLDPATLKHTLFVDLERELSVTRRVLEAVPAEHFAWKPHEKSMPLLRLAAHIAHLPFWMRTALDRDVLNAEEVEPPPQFTSTDALLAYFDSNAEKLRQVVATFDPARFTDTWTMKRAGQVITSKPRDFVYRTWSLNHLIHHRGALAVYLRLLNVKVPRIYFNTADDPAFVFD